MLFPMCCECYSTHLAWGHPDHEDHAWAPLLWLLLGTQWVVHSSQVASLWAWPQEKKCHLRTRFGSNSVYLEWRFRQWLYYPICFWYHSLLRVEVGDRQPVRGQKKPHHGEECCHLFELHWHKHLSGEVNCRYHKSLTYLQCKAMFDHAHPFVRRCYHP